MTETLATTTLLDDGRWSDCIFDGSWRAGQGGTAEVTEPATGDALERIGVASPADVERLLLRAEDDPTAEFTVDLIAQQVRSGELVVSATMPASARDALTSGLWDGTGLLLDDFDQVRATAARLPYVAGW